MGLLDHDCAFRRCAERVHLPGISKTRALKDVSMKGERYEFAIRNPSLVASDVGIINLTLHRDPQPIPFPGAVEPDGAVL